MNQTRTVQLGKGGLVALLFVLMALHVMHDLRSRRDRGRYQSTVTVNGEIVRTNTVSGEIQIYYQGVWRTLPNPETSEVGHPAPAR